MSGTGRFPSIDAEPESWTADPTRWPHIRAMLAVTALAAVGAVAGWWWPGGPAGAILGAVTFLVAAGAVAVPRVLVHLAGADRRLTAADRDRERLALELGVLRTRQDTDHATVSVLGQRVEEQHLAMGECRSQRRNNVLDLHRARNGRT